MENAAERLAQNQMRSARAAQQAAGRTLEQMLQELRETKRATAEELLRRLASLIEAIQRLMVVQEREIAALAAARHSGVFAGRDRAMIRLNQNTQGVAVDARAAGSEVRRVARVLDRAADAQGAAVVAFRAQPVNADGAEQAEERALELLAEALELAAELEQAVEQREIMRQREEVIAAYRGFAEREVALRGETLEITGRELERRELVEARRLGREQDEIRLGLDELRAKTPGLHESRVISHVHSVMDDLALSVTDDLLAGRVETVVSDRQQRIADSLGRLIEALEALMDPAPPSEFAKGQGGGGGGGSQAPLVPPVAELRLIRGLQEQVYNLTRDLDDLSDLDAAERSRRHRDLGREQRDLQGLGRQLLEDLMQGTGGGAGHEHDAE